MIFLIPLIIIIALIFGFDHYYFSEENAKISKKEENISKNNKNYMKTLINKRLEND